LRELIGLCMWCGCPVYSDGPVDFEGVWCNHEVQTELDTEVTRIEALE
jgi:hypothetical protein